MRARRVMAALLLCGSFALALAAPAAVELPLHLLRSGDIGVLMAVDAEVAGQRGRWLIDSGSRFNLIGQRLGRALALPWGDAVRLSTAAGVRHGAQVELPRVRLGDLDRAGVPAVQADLAAIAGPFARQLDGVLGAPFLAGLVLHVDLARERIRIEAAATGGVAAPPNAQPLAWADGLPVLTLELGGRTERYLFDTGAAGGLVHLRAGPQMQLWRVAQLVLGGHRRGQVPLALLPPSALARALPTDVFGAAGLALLDGCAFTADFAAGWLSVQDCRRTDLRGGYGLELAEDGAGVRIAAVLPDSPAAQAGLRAGDRLRRLGTSAPPSLLGAFAVLGRSSRLELEVQRDGAVLARVLTRTHFLPPLAALPVR